MHLRALEADAVRALHELVGEDPELFDELVATFLEDGPQRIAELRRAVDGGDSESAGRAAHTLKTNGATFGATELASLCRRLEAAARADELAAAAGLVDHVEQSWVLVRSDLTSLGQGKPG
jgi:HPt (histidine-containing phosphotransfer) domain-containing protein